MKIKNYRKRRITSLSILFVLLMGLVTNPILLFSRFGHATVQAEDISIQEGYNIFQNLPYDYQGTFYDDVDPEFAWTTAKIEFVYDPTAYSPLSDEYIVTSDFANSESQQPYDETNITMTNGEYFDTTEMRSDDNIYGQFDYTGVGEYRASYSFTDEYDGVSGTDIGFVDSITTGASTTAQIISVLGEHKKVLKFYDNDGAARVIVENTFSSVQTSGTIEFWVRSSDPTFYLALFIMGSATAGSEIQFDADKISVRDGGGYTDIVDPMVVNTWYHIQMDFECGTGGYKGLAADDWHVYVNGVLYGDYDFRNGQTNVVGIKVQTLIGDLGYSYYMDAFGYSWDNDYMIGWNREEYAFFGDYNGTYSFEGEDIGTSGTSIGFIDTDTSGANSGVRIISGILSHKKTLELYDNDGADRYEIQNAFSSGQTAGVVEWWAQNSDANIINLMRLGNEGGDSTGQVYIYQDKHQYYSGGALHDTGLAATDNTWYHYKIVFDCATDTYNIIIDGITYQTGVAFINVATTINYFYFQGSTGDSGYFNYIDAIDYSWSPGYSNGRNRLTENDDILGHYPATYSFTNELVYTMDNNINFFTTGQLGVDSNPIAQIIATEDGHRKAIKFSADGDNGMNSYIRRILPFQISGTFELWLKFIDYGQGQYDFRLYGENGDNGYLTWIMYDSTTNDLRVTYGDGSGVNVDVDTTVSADTWVHLKMEFDCGTDTFSFWIDGIRIINNENFYDDNNLVGLTQYLPVISDGDGNNALEMWIDALGESWDDNYLIGDNLHYNNFLGSETFENYNQTYPGDYYGTESFDYKTESDVYYGTYDFRDDAIGGNPAGWSITETGGTVNVIAEFDGHKKVVEFDDVSGVGNTAIAQIYDQQQSGTIEFWYMNTDVTDFCQFLGKGDVSYGIWFAIRNEKIQYYHTGSWHDATGGGVLDDTWYHISITFDVDSDDYDFSLNGVLLDSNVPFSSDQTYMSWFSMATDTGDLNYIMYIDALGYSWDTTSHGGLGYTVDYNILSQDIEPILEGGYEIDNINFGDSLEVVNILDYHHNVVNITGSSDNDIYFTGNLEVPDQWGDFDFNPYGIGESAGDLDDDDGDYATIGSSSFQGSESSVYSDPSNDVVNNGWITSPLEPKIDDGERRPGTTFSGGTIFGEAFDYCYFDMTDVVIPANNYITKVVVWAYRTTTDAEFWEFLEASYQFEGYTGWSSQIDISGYGWAWDSATWSGLFGSSYGDTEADALQVRLDTERFSSDTTVWEVEALYAQIYYAPVVYDIDYTIEWDVTDPDMTSMDILYYEYKTTVAIQFQLQIWNYDTTSWTTLETQTTTNWIAGSYSLTDPYIDGMNNVKVHFHKTGGAGSTDMGQYIDYLYIDYTNSTLDFRMRSLSIYDTFSQGSGTIEFWAYFMDSPYVNQILFNNNTQIFHNGSLYWRYDSTDVLMVPADFGQWVHFAIVWSGNDVDVYVNGTKEIDTFWGDSDAILTRIDFMSFDNVSFYVDAVGFSWDSDYDVGDNINSHGKAVITALISEGWDVETISPYTSIGISGEFNSHKKFLNLTDDISTGQVSIFDLFSEQTSGTVEWYYKTTSTTQTTAIRMYDGGIECITLLLSNAGNDQYYDGGYQLIKASIADTWQHWRIDFDASTDTYDIYVDDILEITGADFRNVGVALDKMRFETYTANLGYSVYFDSISYSWEEPTSYFLGSYNQHCNIEAVIDFVVDLPFEYYERDILRLIAESRHYTNILANVTVSIYNFNSSSWVEISNSKSTSETLYSYTETDVINGLSKFLDSSGNVRFRYYGFNNSAFNLKIDLLNNTIYFKTVFTYEKTLLLLGTWKYRFRLDEVEPSAYNSTWIYFNVVIQPPNFEGISESEYTTKWVLTSTATTGTRNTVWEDTLTGGDYWDLTDFSSRYFYDVHSVNGDSYVDEGVGTGDPDTNYGASGDLYIYNGLETNFPNDRWVYIEDIFSANYLDDNTTGIPNSQFRVYVDHETGLIIEIHETSDFDEMTITWNTKPAQGGYVTSWNPLGWWWNTVDLTEPKESRSNWYVLFTDDEGDIYAPHSATLKSKESSNKFQIRDYYSKNYHTTAGGGYAYMQTGSTETLGLISPTFTDESLSEGDLFVIDLQTTSDNAQLELYDDGVLQKTINILVGNTEYGRQEVEVYIDSDVTFDQVKITSSLTDVEYLKLYDIKADHWTFTESEDQNTMYINPFGIGEIIMNLGNNSLKIYDNGILQIDTYITITYDLTTYIYQSPLPETVFINLYDFDNNFLNFNEFVVYVDYTINEILLEDQRLGSNEFFVDEGTTIYFDIYDSFNSSIYQASRLAKTFIDITLNVYSLKIKNQKLAPVEYTLKNNDTVITKSGYLFENEILEYSVATGTYIFEYLKEGESTWENFTFSFTSNQIFVLNRSKMCFLSYSNQRGAYLEFNNYKTYINGTLLYENIFYRDIGVNIGIEIKDRYDISIKNQTYTVVSGDNYISVILTMYSLKIMNQQQNFNHININRDPNYYESGYSWSEWVAPNEIVKFNLFPGYYKINLTDNEGGSYSFYAYTLNGDDILLISSNNVISQVIYNIANVNTTIGNQITNVEINITNQNSEINNTIVNIEINLSNVNSTLGDLLTNINLDIININNNISNLYTFTENNFLNLGNNINNSFTLIENNIIAINQTISTLVIGLDGKITIVNATINTMFTEMSNQFIVTQSTLDYSFTFLNQTIIQIGNNITNNQIALQNLIIQRANDIDSSLINIQNLINLVNNTVANESLVIQTLINLIGANITSNHIVINSLLNLIDNNITNNNIQLVSILEIIGNNITTNHFVIQTLIDIVGNNITNNHIELLTNLNLINTTISQNQIELINRLLFINNSVNEMALDLTNQILLVNNTIYSAILDVSVSIDFNSDNILGNISLTYQQNDFLTELYKQTMFSQLLNWSGSAYNYTLMEDRIDVWEFINNYKNESVQILLKYQDKVDNLTVSAQNTIDQYLPKDDVEYRLKSITTGEYLSDWEALPENRSVNFGFFETEVPYDPKPLVFDFTVLLAFIIIISVGGWIVIISWSYMRRDRNIVPEDTRKRYKRAKKRSDMFDHRL